MTGASLIELIDKKRSDIISQQAFLVLCMICFFLFFNPFIALFFIAILSVYFQLPKLPFLIIGSLAFTLFFFFREYDVAWNASSDDVPSYIELYLSNKSISLSEIFLRFLTSPGDHEPLWHLPFWVLINIFNGSEKSFIFIHYFLIFYLLFYTLNSISDRYYIIVILAYFFLTPVAIDSVFHIWRQQIASTVFLLGCNVYLYKKGKAGVYFIYLSCFIHLVCLYFLIIFLFFNFLRNRKALEKNAHFFLYAIMLCFVFILTFNIAINFLASFNLDRVVTYAEGTGVDGIRMFVVMSIFMGILFLSHVLVKNDDLNKLIIFITFVVTTMTIAFPFADSIFTRLAYFTVPLIGIYFVRWFILNFPSKWILAFVLFTFITGFCRILPLITQKRASAQFLAYGHPLDPVMGIIKMLFFLS